MGGGPPEERGPQPAGHGSRLSAWRAGTAAHGPQAGVLAAGETRHQGRPGAGGAPKPSARDPRAPGLAACSPHVRPLEGRVSASPRRPREPPGSRPQGLGIHAAPRDSRTGTQDPPPGLDRRLVCRQFKSDYRGTVSRAKSTKTRGSVTHCPALPWRSGWCPQTRPEGSPPPGPVLPPHRSPLVGKWTSFQRRPL